MQIIDIDTDPKLSTLDEKMGHIFAGHINEIVGVDYINSEVGNDKGRKYKGQELVDNVDKIKTIWINHNGRDNKEFSIKIGAREVIKQFINDYGGMITDGSVYFIVCNDTAYLSSNSQYNHKPFFPIDNIEQYKLEFRLWQV